MPYVQEKLGNLYQKLDLLYKSENTKMHKLFKKNLIQGKPQFMFLKQYYPVFIQVTIIRLTLKWKTTYKARLMNIKKKQFLIPSALP